jgi:aryl-alcohol dehydrogenase-like predicted oxidoreductase
MASRRIRASAPGAPCGRLEIDTIDLYDPRSVDPETPIEDTVGAMAELVRQARCATSGSARRHRRRSGAHKDQPIAAPPWPRNRLADDGLAI